MKRVLFLLMITLVAGSAAAQPKVRRNQQAQQSQQAQQRRNGGQGLTQRARLMFPTAIDMPEDVVWRRDIYREIDLNADANAGLYYPVEPVDREMNLFTYIFKLALNGYIPVYEYRLDGNESFSDSARVQMRTVLDNYHIFYEEQNGRIRVDNSDIPSAEVKMYYLKESAYYDQANASFHRKVLSLCPVMLREDDFGGEAAKYPLFWVKYSDLEPFLSRQTVMTSNLNNAATMSMDDYFTLNRYQGKIYKTTNMLGKTLAQYCENDSALAREQRRIEGELQAFEQNIFGSPVKRDSLDSIAAADPKAAKAVKKAKKSRRSSSARVGKKQKSTEASSSSSSAARVTVRRQRH
ncbi:MAG: gliding motility protein GldN [Prevotella sp.]|nr:gliding motility protein GldN [Prevotella sp.]